MANEIKRLICRARKRISAPRVIGELAKRSERLVDIIRLDSVRISIYLENVGLGGFCL